MRIKKKGLNFNCHCNSVCDMLHFVQVADVLLQEGADVNQEGASAKTPLHKAILLGRPDFVEYLIHKNASTEIRDFQVY